MLKTQAPVVNRSARGLRLEIPSRYNAYIPVLLGVWLAAWAVAEALILLGWAGALAGGRFAPVPAGPGGAFFFLVFTAAGAFVAWRLAWVLDGREIVELKDGVLSLSRALGRREGLPKRFLWSQVRDLRAGSFRCRILYPSWGRRFVGKGDAFISFRHRGRLHAFGRGLRQEEARILVDLLHEHAPAA